MDFENEANSSVKNYKRRLDKNLSRLLKPVPVGVALLDERDRLGFFFATSGMFIGLIFPTIDWLIEDALFFKSMVPA